MPAGRKPGAADRRDAAPARKLDARQALALVDRIYAAGSEPRAVARWLAEIVSGLGAERCRLVDRQGVEVASVSAPAASTRKRSKGAASARGRREPSAESYPLGAEEGHRLEIAGLPSPGTAERAFLSALVPHVARALLASPGTPGDERSTGRVSAAALDRMAVGVLMTGESGELLHANLAGRKMLEAGEGIEQVRGRIRIATKPASEILGGLKERPEAGKRSRPSARISLRRGDRPPLEVFAVGIDGLGVDEHSALAIFVSDPESGLEPPPAVLREHFGLTRREAEVVGQILLGHSIDEAATSLGIHRETIRMHLKQIFKKVGTRRQVDLVRLLLSGVPRLRWE